MNRPCRTARKCWRSWWTRNTLGRTGREDYRLTAAMQNGSADEALFREVNRNVALLKEFKAWLNGRGIRATFTTPEDLRRCVAEALE